MANIVLKIKEELHQSKNLTLDIIFIEYTNNTIQKCQKIVSFFHNIYQRINIKQLQAMAQMHSYFVTNVKFELKFLDDKITSEKLNETLNQIALAIENEVNLFDNNNPKVDFVFENINEEEEVANLEEVNNHELEITNFIDLSTSLLNNNNKLHYQDDKKKYNKS
ncbi:hypothetical protein C1645_845563 [Glomus cerebriforme]|uniref:Uncharacterized protein n=1 Tax=Glomus cerebriforme TaxID=658196 RepID=A0A397SA12_9GLOM|nr:hypothetical protein C1645_845563 [Glomus cerebriforme]